MMIKRRKPADDEVISTGLEESQPPHNDKEVTMMPRILSGSVGSIITALAVTPLEVVKIRQQASGVKPMSYSNFSLSGVELCRRGCGTLVFNNGLMECSIPVETTSIRSNATPSYHAGGTFSTLFSIFKREGWSGIYAGLKPTLLMSVPNTVLYFAAYDEISTRLRKFHALNNLEKSTAHALYEIDDGEKRQAYIPLLAGSTARLLASLSTAPLELVRTRQASAIGNGEKIVPGMVEEFRLILRTNGFSSLFTGLAPTLWRDVPFSAIYWLFLEKFKNDLYDSTSLGTWGGRYYKDQGLEAPPSLEVMHSFVSGAGAGAIAAFCTTPFDVVKTRKQMIRQAEVLPIASCDHFGLKEYSGSQHNNNQQRGISVAVTEQNRRINQVGTFGHTNLNTFSCMRQIFRDEGISGLWRGNTTRMVKVAPACAVMISCYEFGKKVFGEVL